MSLNLMKSLRNAVVAGVLLSAGLANAALLQFNLTGDYTASWQLNSTGAPENGANGVGFVVYDVLGQFPGSAIDVADLYFYNADEGGGMIIDDYYGDTTLLVTDGSQLYTGLEEDLVSFILGTFTLTDFDGPGTYTLTVTEVDTGPGPGTDPGEVPEPATAAMMFGGLGLMYALRKRRNRH